MADSPTTAGRRKKRAIALAGGGPAAGFVIGALGALEKRGIGFVVWALSCIGAWVGLYYHTRQEPQRAEQTYQFFREHGFRDTASYRGYPVNKAFAPNLEAFTTAWLQHAWDAETYRDVFGIANELGDVAAGWTQFLGTPQKWFKQGDRNLHVLNNVLAVHPLSRFITSMMYRAGINGLSNIYYPDSTFLADMHLGDLDLSDEPTLGQKSRAQLLELVDLFSRRPVSDERKKLPEIYHNAWRVKTDNQPGRLQLFNNKWIEYRRGKDRPQRDYLPISSASLCACSALPFIEQTVRIPNDDDREYSEGALVDTVNFLNLVEDHEDLDEIWVCRIVDFPQLRKPQDLHDSLGNLCQQFAAEVGKNDIELFKNHLRKRAGRIPRVVEIELRPDSAINTNWDRANLETGRDEGWRAVESLLASDPGLREHETPAPPWP